MTMTVKKTEKREQRCAPAELRLVQSATEPRIEGYAIVFESWSDPICGMFKEKVARGALTKTLQEADVMAFWSHDTSRPLGRVSAGTLKLRADDHGLFTEIFPPAKASWGIDAVESIARGDVKGMSFCFETVRDSWSPDGAMRTLEEIRLIEVSPVSFPAYPETEVIVAQRSIEQWRELAGRKSISVKLKKLALLEYEGRILRRELLDARTYSDPNARAETTGRPKCVYMPEK